MKTPSKTQRKRLSIYNKQNGRCIYCNTTMWSKGFHEKGQPGKMATFEHIHPKGLGGSKKYLNLACSCSKCNSERGQIEHFKFIEIRKHKNWQQLATEEKWKMLGIYSRKKREFTFKRLRQEYKHKYPRLFIIVEKCHKIILLKNKHWHFTKVRYYKIRKSIPEFKKDLKGLQWRLYNKSKSLILNAFKQFEIQSFNHVSY